MSELAVVTGAGTGIGRACALVLAERGLRTICVGRRLEPLEQVVDDVTTAGGHAVAVAANVARDEGVRRVARATHSAPVRALVHCAAEDYIAPLAEVTRDAFAAVVATNLGAPLFLTQALASSFAPGAGVTVVGSISAVAGRPNQGLYGASKAALIGLTRNLSVELAPHLRFNCVCPGPTATGLFEQFQSDALNMTPTDAFTDIAAHYGDRLPLRRIAEPQEVALTIVHVTLDASAVTGTVIPVDLGYTAQ